MKKKFLAVLLAGAMVLGVTACGSSKDRSKSTTEAAKKEETTTITLAAAASLEKCYTEKLIPMFEKDNKGIFADRSVPEVVEELYKSSNIAHVRVAKLLKEKYL